MEVWKIKTKTDSKETKDKIIDLFYEKHLRPSDIAEQLKVAKSYITKVIQKDSRYIEEKESRKAKNKENFSTVTLKPINSIFNQSSF